MAAVYENTRAPHDAAKIPSVIISLITFFPHTRHCTVASRAVPPMDHQRPERYPYLHPRSSARIPPLSPIADAHTRRRSGPNASTISPTRSHRARTHLSSSQRLLAVGHRDLRLGRAREPSRRDSLATSLGDARRRRRRDRAGGVRHHHHDRCVRAMRGRASPRCDARDGSDRTRDRSNDRSSPRAERSRRFDFEWIGGFGAQYGVCVVGRTVCIDYFFKLFMYCLCVCVRGRSSARAARRRGRSFRGDVESRHRS